MMRSDSGERIDDEQMRCGLNRLANFDGIDGLRVQSHCSPGGGGFPQLACDARKLDDGW